MPTKWWRSLHEALNAPKTLEALTKEATDNYDIDSRTGLCILQLIVMKKAPKVAEGSWSPLLEKVASCSKVAYAIADFLLKPFSKAQIMNELRGQLATNLAYLTPSSVWFLEDEKLMSMKSQ